MKIACSQQIYVCVPDKCTVSRLRRVPRNYIYVSIRTQILVLKVGNCFAHADIALLEGQPKSEHVWGKAKVCRSKPNPADYLFQFQAF